jgi:ribonuclease BN (tRNA processing enzyme)
MRLTTIGTGTAAPSPARVSAAHLLEVGRVRLLMDCGSGSVHRMAALGVDWSAITHVALTHFDADHVSDLATLMVAWRHGQLPPRAAPVEILGPPGLRPLLDRLAEALWDKLLAPGYPVTVVEIAFGDGVDLGDGVRLTTRKVPHTPESVAYSVEYGGGRVVYTGDTGFDGAVGEWARGADVLLCECSLPASLAIPSHLTPEQCGELAAIARPALLALTHLYPPVDAVDIPAVVAERFDGPVVVAHDGWTHDIEER